MVLYAAILNFTFKMAGIFVLLHICRETIQKQKNKQENKAKTDSVFFNFSRTCIKKVSRKKGTKNTAHLM